jgi:Protein of unknown function (DUF2752)
LRQTSDDTLCQKPAETAQVFVHLFLALAGVVAAAIFAAALIAGAPLPECPFHLATGLYCPGCGSTRAMRSLLRGHIADAIRYNPLLMATLAYGTAAAASRYLPTIRQHRRMFADKIHVTVVRAIPWIFIGYFLLRNLPFFPFTALTPSGTNSNNCF